MSNSQDNQDPFESEDWKAYEKRVRADCLPKMQSSAVFVSIHTDDPEKMDIQFALQLGMAVLLGKPILLVAREGQKISGKMRDVADHIITADMRTPAGQEAFARELNKYMKEMRDAIALDGLEGEDEDTK